MFSTDTIVLDRLGAVHLWAVMSDTTERLAWDRIVVGTLVDQASGVLGHDERASCDHLRRAHDGLDRLAVDLRRRLDLIQSLWADVDEIDRLSAQVDEWGGSENDTALDRLVIERDQRVLQFVGGDRHLASLIVALLNDGHHMADSIGLARELAHELRIDEVVDVLGITREEADAHVREIDRQIGLLVAHGYRGAEAAAAVSMAITSGLDLEEALAISASRHDMSIVDALGWMSMANGLGVTVGEILALDGFVTNFEVFDNATGGATDDKVSVDDLLYVVEHSWDFTAGQVLAAQAVLDHHELRARIDTAEANGNILGPESFGHTERADGIMSLADLQIFTVKAQINTVLGRYADEIDVAGDASGNVDGFFSRNDFERFIADNPDLPAEVQAAAQTMIDAGWFDRTWLENHRDELALGAAVLAGGVVIVLSAGSATPLVLAFGATAGASAASATTFAINMTGDAADGSDGVLGNAFTGAMIGLSVVGLPASVSAIGATTRLARFAALAGVTAETTGVIALGGFDLAVPERMEDDVHAVTGAVSKVAGGVALGYTAARWSARRVASGPYQDHIDSLQPRIAGKRQDRHLGGTQAWVDRGRQGYFTSADDAQAVLDAVRDGSADILGRTTKGHLLVRYDEVTGINMNEMFEYIEQPTNVFLIKGTVRPSVVPTSPQARPAS